MAVTHPPPIAPSTGSPGRRVAEAALACLPRERLVVGVTPLLPAPRLSAELGVELWIKRDDLTGFGLGGNKVRILEYLLGEARASGADTLVTGGGPGSNYLALAAIACATLDLGCVAVLYGTPPDPEPLNLQLARAAGADIHFTSDDDRATVDAGIAATAARLTAAGRRVHVAGRGGATPASCFGYVRAAFELDTQLANQGGLTPSHVVVATGSCGTQAGLHLGRALTAAPWTVLGVSVSRPVPECQSRIATLATAAHAALVAGAEPRVSGLPDLPEPAVLDGIGPDYGRPSTAGKEAAALAARTEGLVLDQTFTAKAMAGLIAEARAGRLPGPVVFLHTGGAGGVLGGKP